MRVHQMKPSIALLALVAFSALGCRVGFDELSPDGSGDSGAVDSSSSDVAPDTTADAMTDADAVGVPFTILGHWVRAEGAMDFGDLWFAEVGGQIRGVYEFEDGRIVGEPAGDTFEGWWSETRDRMPPNDAGAVTFVFTTDASGSHAMGMWDEGGRRNSGWDLDYVDATIPPDVMTLFMNDAEFVDGR